MAFNLNNLLSTLDSSIGLLDSSSDLLSILQAINVTNPTMGHGKSRKKTYDTVASLPAASVSLRGSLAVVQTIGNWAASGNADNGLYVCNGSDWALIQGLDSAGIQPPFQGSNFGYASGGLSPTSSNVIDKFPFSSDANATDVGNLTAAREGPAGQSSQTHGYNSGGWTGAIYGPIDKFPFTSDANATDVGDLTQDRYQSAGQSSSDYGYTSGGAGDGFNVIDKFPFSSDANATDVGDLTVSRSAAAGQSDVVNGFGYTSGGNPWSSPAPAANVIDKFPFSTDANATDVGDLTVSRRWVAGQSSTAHGYTSGGNPDTNVIDKFPFTSGGNASDVGDLISVRTYKAGQSSTTHGYASGGIPLTDDIQKFPFSTDANATYVGDLSVARYVLTGQQY